jgi:hypothetical protein
MSGPNTNNRAKTTKLESDRLSADIPRPWLDINLPDQERYDSYLAVARQKCREIIEANDLLEGKGVLGKERNDLIFENEENKFWISELAKLRKESPAEFCVRIAEHTPTGSYAELPDNRTGFKPHRAYLFLVVPSKGTVLEELKNLLGEEAANQLVKDWGSRCDLNQKLEVSKVALFLDSNNKARNRKYAALGDVTTQEEDFAATGNEFASDLAVTLLCARIYRKMKDNVALSEGEQDLYQKLKDGVIRSCSGALALDDIGRLRALNFFLVVSGSNMWASCSSPSRN